VKLLILVLMVVVAVGGYYLYQNPGVVGGVVDEVVDPLLEGTALEGTTGKTKLYKWRDGKGTWHVTDEPPSNGTDYEVLEYRHDVNVVPAVTEKKD
jgi:hypothetical protein